jgi:adenosylcobyric acid synthase
VGFVLNKFRGDRSLLAPAPEDLCRLTGVPTVGVIPWLDHGLPDEDGATITSDERSGPSVTVVRYPTASNLDEFKRLEQVASVRWGDRPGDVTDADLVVLPGSKHVAADLRWLYASGMAEAVRVRAEAGRSILGICGGMQMLGERIEDPAGVDGAGDGLGLLPLSTTFATAKRAEHTSARFERLSEPWAALSGIPMSGYQIRHGETTLTEGAEAALPGGLGFIRGPVLGIYLHGALKTSEVLEALFHATPGTSLEDTFEGLADAIEESIDIPALLRTAGQR